MSLTGRLPLSALVRSDSFDREAAVVKARLAAPALAPSFAATTTDLSGLAMECREAIWFFQSSGVTDTR